MLLACMRATCMHAFGVFRRFRKNVINSIDALPATVAITTGDAVAAPPPLILIVVFNQIDIPFCWRQAI